MICVGYIGRRPWKESGISKEKPADLKKEGGMPKERSADIQKLCIDEYVSCRKEMVLKKKYTDFDMMAADGIMGKYDCIIAASIYFCGADCREAKSMFLDTLYQAGLHFIIADEGIDSGRMSYEELCDYFEEKKHLMHSCRMKKINESKGPGYRLSAAVPYGYVKEEKTGYLIKDMQVADYVKKIYAEVMSGVSLKDIASFLNKENADTPLAHKKKMYGHDTKDLKNKWNENTVRRIIYNPVYAGISADACTGGRSSASSGRNIYFDAYISPEEYMHIAGGHAGKAYAAGKKQDGRGGYADREGYADRGRKNDRDDILHFAVYCKEKNRRLACRWLKEPEEYVFCCTSVCEKGESASCRIAYKTIYDAVMKQYEKERDIAAAAARSIDSERMKDAYNMQKKDIEKRMDEALERMKPAMYERVHLYEEYISSKIDDKQYEKLLGEHISRYSIYNEELEELFCERKRIDVTYSGKNPWIRLFTGTEAVNDTVDRVVADTLMPHKKAEACVRFKHAHWKEELMKSIVREEFYYGKKEQERL